MSSDHAPDADASGDPPLEAEDAASRPAKAEGAYRTISEVAENLDVPQHVLRFWETKFTQVKPLKRAGGRRYYRPDDVLLLQGIRHLLYGEGYTLRGVQRILREKGVREVKAIGARLGGGAIAPGETGDPDDEAAPTQTAPPAAAPPVQIAPRDASSTPGDGAVAASESAPAASAPPAVAIRVEDARARLAEALVALDRAETILKARMSMPDDD